MLWGIFFNCPENIIDSYSSKFKKFDKIYLIGGDEDDEDHEEDEDLEL